MRNVGDSGDGSGELFIRIILDQGLFYRTQQLRPLRQAGPASNFSLTPFGLSISRSFLIDTSARRVSGEIFNYRLACLKCFDLAEALVLSPMEWFLPGSTPRR